MNIPIYRAKKIDSDEYVIGYHCNVCQLDFIISDDALKGFDSDNNRVLFGSCESGVVEIDKSTLAINFPDMLDSQGNKIFASLSKDGRGGNIVEFEHIEYLEDDEPSYMIKGLCIFAESSLFVKDIDNRFDRVFYDEMGCNFRNKELKVIGIQE